MCNSIAPGTFIIFDDVGSTNTFYVGGGLRRKEARSSPGLLKSAIILFPMGGVSAPLLYSKTVRAAGLEIC